MDQLLPRVVVPARLALVVRGEETVGYNPNLNVWHRLDDITAEVLRWLRAERDRSMLASHLSRRFTLADAGDKVESILRWAVLRRLLYLDTEPVIAPPGTPAQPLSTVYWICTQACNLRCTYCYQDATVARPNELSTAEGCDLIDQAAEAGVNTFIFTGGEPFARRDLLEIAHYSKSAGLHTNVITNGGYITPRRVDEIAAVFDRVTVSLDHGIPHHHDRSRGPGSWRRAASAIDLLLEAGVAVDVNSVLTHSGLADVDALVRFVRERRVGQHRIVPQYPMGRGGTARDDELSVPELLSLSDDLHQVRDALREVASDEEAVKCGEHTTRSSKGTRRNHCGAGLSEVSVDPEGWVYPCKLLQYEQYRGANVRDRRLIEIFSTDAVLQRIKKPFVDSLQPCSTCIVKYQCGGGCRGIHASFSGEWTVAEPLFCAQIRREFELEMFASTGNVPARGSARFIRVEDAGESGADPLGGTVFIPLAQVGRKR